MHDSICITIVRTNFVLGFEELQPPMVTDGQLHLRNETATDAASISALVEENGKLTYLYLISYYIR